MKAIVIKDKNLYWETVSDPLLKEDEVLIKVHYAGINRADILQRDGKYSPPPGASNIMGLEISGEIVRMGIIAEREGRFKIGDKVCALLGGGGYAQYVAVKSCMVMPVPENCSMLEAAAIPEAFAAAYMMLFTEGGLKKGNTVLVTAGASGLASVLIPMAKTFGARVFTTIHRDELYDGVAALKPDYIINTSRESLEHVMKTEMEKGTPIDVAIDCLGGDIPAQCLPYMQMYGRWIVIASLAGDVVPVDFRMLYIRNVRVIGTTLRSRTDRFKGELLQKLIKEFWRKIAGGKLKPHVFAEYSIKDAAKAHDLLLHGKNIGKVVLKVS